METEHDALYPLETIVVCDGVPLLATVTLVQYGWGEKVTINVVVAAVGADSIVHGAKAMSILLHSTPDDGTEDWLEVAKVFLESQYRAHSAPVSAAYMAYCDCVAVLDRSSSRTVMSYMATPIASARLLISMANRTVNPLPRFFIFKYLNMWIFYCHLNIFSRTVTGTRVVPALSFQEIVTVMTASSAVVFVILTVRINFCAEGAPLV